MSSFPRLPLLLGDTDDENSLHLNSHVGPSRPLPQRSPLNTQREIRRIFEEDDDLPSSGYTQMFTEYTSTGKLDVNVQELEHKKQQLLQKLEQEKQRKEQEEAKKLQEQDDLYQDDTTAYSSDEDYIADEDDNEDESDSDDESEPSEALSWPEIPSFNIAIVVLLVAFLLQLALFFRNSSSKDTVENYYEVNSKFNQIDKQLEVISSKYNVIEQKHNQIQSNINLLTSKILLVEKNLSGLERKVPDITQYKILEDDFNKLQKLVDSQNTITNTTELNQKLDFLNNEITKLTKINQEFTEAKDGIVNELIRILPEHLPVYLENNSIRYLPEFNKFLYNFIDGYIQENSQNWGSFLKENEAEMQQFVANLLNQNQVGGLNKLEFKKYLTSQLAENNKIIFEKFNNLVDSIDFLNGTVDTPNFASDRVILSNLLEVISKSTINVNYADFRLGSRILGYATTKSGNSKSLFRKFFLGWYDLAKSVNPSIKDLKANANNLLIDGLTSWQCVPTNNGICSVGIRLSNKIILSDVIIHTVSAASTPLEVAVYIRPKNSNEVSVLTEYINKFKLKFLLPTANNIYTRDFIKIKEALLPSQTVNHIKIPLSLVNSRVLTRDVYFEFHGANDKIEILNINVYGISDYHAYKYSRNINSLVEALSNSVAEQHNQGLKYEFQDPVGILGEEDL